MRLSRRQAIAVIGAGVATRLGTAFAQVEATRPVESKRSGDAWIFQGTIVASMIAVPVTFNAGPDFLFEVCTTCPGYSVRTEVAAQLGLHGNDPVFGAKIGEFELDHDAPFDLIPTGSRTPPGLAGVIGLDVFRGLSLGLNFATGELQVGPASLPEPDGQTIFGYAADSIPTVPVTIGDVTFDANVATGQIRSPLLVTDDVAKRIHTLSSADAGEAQVDEKIFKLTEYKLAERPRVGATPLDIDTVISPPPSAVGSLGAIGLKRMVVRIDQRNRRVQIVRG